MTGGRPTPWRLRTSSVWPTRRTAGWEGTVDVGLPEQRQPIHIWLDPEVLRWFKAHGPGYQTRINAVLRAFVRARQRAERAGS